MRSVDDYLALIPPLNANKPNFRAVITATVAPYVAAQQFLANLPAAFDLDTAIGAQLDIVGQWVGISRNVPVPIIQLWFALDTPGQGLDQAPWQGTQISRSQLFPLNDTDYRRLLRARIKANYSDGFTDGAQAALSTYFLAPTLIFVVDRGVAIKIQEPPLWLALDTPGQGLDEGIWEPTDPTLILDSYPQQPTASLDWTIGVAGTLPSAVDLEILGQDLIAVKPLGVNVDIAVTTINGAPLFGLDMGNEYVAGLDTGAWGASPDYVVEHLL